MTRRWRATIIAVPVDWGRYRLEIETARADGPATSDEFDAGWYVEATSTETPDGLEIALDKESYTAGDTAKLQGLAALCRRGCWSPSAPKAC